jgi:hypothetical protein
MRQHFRVIAGAVLTVTLAGCGDSQPDSGPVPFKATTSPAIDALRENMSKVAKDSTYTKKQMTEAESKATAATKEAPKEAPKK